MARCSHTALPDLCVGNTLFTLLFHRPIDCRASEADFRVIVELFYSFLDMEWLSGHQIDRARQHLGSVSNHQILCTLVPNDFDDAKTSKPAIVVISSPPRPPEHVQYITLIIDDCHEVITQTFEGCDVPCGITQVSGS